MGFTITSISVFLVCIIITCVALWEHNLVAVLTGLAATAGWFIVIIYELDDEKIKNNNELSDL